MITRLDGDVIIRMDGSRLRELRLAHGLSQRELATRIGVSGATICLWENEKAAPRSFDKLVDFYDDALSQSGAVTVERMR